MDSKLDLREYTKALRSLLSGGLIEFYLGFCQTRLQRKEGDGGKLISSLYTLNLVLQTTLLSAAPVLIYTC